MNHYSKNYWKVSWKLLKDKKFVYSRDMRGMIHFCLPMHHIFPWIQRFEVTRVTEWRLLIARWRRVRRMIIIGGPDFRYNRQLQIPRGTWKINHKVETVDKDRWHFDIPRVIKLSHSKSLLTRNNFQMYVSKLFKLSSFWNYYATENCFSM